MPGSVLTSPRRAGSFALSAPTYDERTGDIWCSDGGSGSYVVRLTGPASRSRFGRTIVNPGP